MAFASSGAIASASSAGELLIYLAISCLRKSDRDRSINDFACWIFSSMTASIIGAMALTIASLSRRVCSSIALAISGAIAMAISSGAILMLRAIASDINGAIAALMAPLSRSVLLTMMRSRAKANTWIISSDATSFRLIV